MQWIKQALSPLIGDEAERAARTFLEQQGLTFVAKNYRCRSGEIDLIMLHKNELVFVEVKYRSNTQHGSSIEYFHATKRKKFESAVMHYLMAENLNPSSAAYRIDLVGIDATNHKQEIKWLQSI